MISKYVKIFIISYLYFIFININFNSFVLSRVSNDSAERIDQIILFIIVRQPYLFQLIYYFNKIQNLLKAIFRFTKIVIIIL